MKKFLICITSLLLLSAFVFTLAACSDPGAGAPPIKTDAASFQKEDLLSPTINFSAHLEKNNIDYNDAWDVPSVIDKQKSDCILEYLAGKITVDWNKVEKEHIEARKAYIVNDTAYLYAYYKAKGYSYTSVEHFAQSYYKYDLDTYAESMARSNIRADILYSVFLEAADIFPDKKDIATYYDEQLALVAKNSKITVEEVEEEYESRYGQGYLYCLVRTNYLRFLTNEHFEKEGLISLPEVDPASRPEFDKTAILPENYTECTDATNLVKMTIKTENGTAAGDIYIRLYSEAAPLTVANFKKLVAQGFYDGLIFHRSVPGFCLQGGDPNGNGSGGASQKIHGEFYENGFANHLSHLDGVVSMARGGNDYNSASSQFFITLSDDNTTALNGKYAAFGYVVYGMDLVNKLSGILTDGGEMPIEKITIEKAVFVKPIS